MKVNEAPEKIYFDGESRACKLPIFSSQNIEYIRIDSFIEKATEYLNEKFYFNNLHYAVENNSFNCMEEMYEDFRKYMEGE